MDYEIFNKLGKHQAIEFANWIGENCYIQPYTVFDKKDMWCKMDLTFIAANTEELYNIYINE